MLECASISLIDGALLTALLPCLLPFSLRCNEEALDLDPLLRIIDEPGLDDGLLGRWGVLSQKVSGQKKNNKKKLKPTMIETILHTTLV